MISLWLLIKIKQKLQKKKEGNEKLNVGVFYIIAYILLFSKNIPV